MVLNTMGWLSEMGSRVGDHLRRRCSLAAETKTSTSATSTTQVGILAFETAKIMSRLLSLYKSLDEAEVSKLRNQVMKSRGVAYLTSKDESFLLTLACAERLEDLDKVASTVARLGHRCSDFGLNRFDLVYTDLKLGIIDLGKLEYGSKDSHKRIEKMEKLVYATSRLYAALESLSEMETSERKLHQWRNNSTSRMALQAQATSYDLFNQKIGYQRKQVTHLKATSLWSQTFDKSVGLMARIVCIVYARICVVFGPFVSFLPHVSLRNVRCSHRRDIIRIQPEYCLIEPIREQVVTTRSGPIPTVTKPKLVRFHSQKSILYSADLGASSSNNSSNNNRVFNAAGPATVGGSGLTLHYANLILLLEKYLDSGVTIGDDARGALYDTLPENLKTMVRTKLAKKASIGAAEEEGDGESLAEGWREAMREIMGWLGPVANDTAIWQAERSFGKRRFELRPPVLLLQTLHFSDKEKVEAAVAEVLVGLSFIYRYENRRDCGGGRVVGGGRCSFDGASLKF
ncbi:hypothetical protein RHGRI_011766 [Rhododendron griersonianum]|uniref:Avr9/Cf-9 rapidly elicited protein 137 n=1 Tax=Rhododendron griersonianum TaxID=479676 RepID=A0AAV6KPE9_9ERIC|nr:hypothetical protein RHGRI_011766 [Rhododendron griersonianum]